MIGNRLAMNDCGNVCVRVVPCNGLASHLGLPLAFCNCNKVQIKNTDATDNLAYQDKNGPGLTYLEALLTPCIALHALRSSSTAQLVPPSQGIRKTWIKVLLCSST